MSAAAHSEPSLGQKLFAEFAGTAMLLCVVIGSGIMADKLSGGNVAIALLANTLATVFALYVLIEALGPISGAHFNPVVTLMVAVRGGLVGGNPAATAALFIIVLAGWLGCWRPVACNRPQPTGLNSPRFAKNSAYSFSRQAACVLGSTC